LKKKESTKVIFQGYSQFEISKMLRISQLTISRDINYMQSKNDKKDIDPNALLYNKYEKWI